MDRAVDSGLSAAELQDRIDAARAGSAEALGMLLAPFRDYLLFVANRELEPELSAKIGPSDVVQETFVHAQRAIAGFAGSSEAELLAWLRQILINNVYGARRKYCGTQARNVAIEVPLNDSRVGPAAAGLPADIETPSQVALADEQLRAVESVLASLPADYATVLRLRYWEQLSLADIATRMDRTADAVQKLWFRAIERLRRELNPDGPS